MQAQAQVPKTKNLGGGQGNLLEARRTNLKFIEVVAKEVLRFYKIKNPRYQKQTRKGSD